MSPRFGDENEGYRNSTGIGMGDIKDYRQFRLAYLTPN